MFADLAPSSWLTSVLAHVAGIGAVLLLVRSAPPLPVAPETVELTMAAVEPPPAPPPEVIVPAEVPAPREITAAAPPRPKAPVERPREPAPAKASDVEAPALTGTTLTSERGSFTSIVGDGTAMDGPVGPGGGGTAAPVAAPAAPAAPAPASGGAALTARADLARLPAPPDLSARLLANYPARAKALGDAGRATLSVVVLPDGTLGAIDVRSATSAEFGKACRDTLTGSRWLPPVDRSGRLVATRVGYTCRFDVR